MSDFTFQTILVDRGLPRDQALRQLTDAGYALDESVTQYFEEHPLTTLSPRGKPTLPETIEMTEFIKTRDVWRRKVIEGRMESAGLRPADALEGIAYAVACRDALFSGIRREMYMLGRVFHRRGRNCHVMVLDPVEGGFKLKLASRWTTSSAEAVFLAARR